MYGFNAHGTMNKWWSSYRFFMQLQDNIIVDEVERTIWFASIVVGKCICIQPNLMTRSELLIYFEQGVFSCIWIMMLENSTENWVISSRDDDDDDDPLFEIATLFGFEGTFPYVLSSIISYLFILLQTKASFSSFPFGRISCPPFFLPPNAYFEVPRSNFLHEGHLLIMKRCVSIDQFGNRTKNFTDDIIPWITIKTEHHKVKRSRNGLICCHPVEREVFVVDRICGLADDTCLHLDLVEKMKRDIRYNVYSLWGKQAYSLVKK